jgi:N-acyl-D-amino-acid deacylase
MGKLELDEPAFGHLKHIKPPAGGKANPLLAKVTVRQCLNHCGGWDRAKSGDPLNWEPQICRALRVRPPLSPARFLSFMLTVGLDFPPGTESRYSNVGYVVLGEVIAAVSGQSYEKFAVEQVLKPAGIVSARLEPRDGRYPAGMAHRHLAGSFVPLPPMQLPMMDAAGGWVASAVDVARLLTSLDGSRGEPVLGAKGRAWMVEPPPPPLRPGPSGTYTGMGWDTVLPEGRSYTYFKDGSYQGIRTYAKRLAAGLNWVLLFNASLELDETDDRIRAAAVREVRQRVEGLGAYPDVDLFKDFA